MAEIRIPKPRLVCEFSMTLSFNLSTKEKKNYTNLL